MLLKINEQKEILEYVTIGGLPDSIEYNGIVPDDFEINFKPAFYMLQNDEIIENSDYAEPTDTPPVSSPTSVQETINKLGEVTAKIADDDNQIKSALNRLGLAVANLQQTKEVK
ncbi:DUF2977 domain-containing protein [Pediococcus pentosaceus]|uniref:DUF2977 domain-containing protein n=1 Tax=Pediococcus pentosaceus TaxID=1255 RepID=A0AB73HEU5_PEDPE|nr:DUF2977 domain-containing protein [Pediococcus pentosaceus]MBF7114524.1 DUF2977 domain-containing protein [Pediococcus pentosaceus]